MRGKGRGVSEGGAGEVGGGLRVDENVSGSLTGVSGESSASPASWLLEFCKKGRFFVERARPLRGVVAPLRFEVAVSGACESRADRFTSDSWAILFRIAFAFLPYLIVTRFGDGEEFWVYAASESESSSCWVILADACFAAKRLGKTC